MRAQAKGQRRGAPIEAQRSGFDGVRRSGGMSETCRSRRGEGYEARDDEKQDKSRRHK